MKLAITGCNGQVGRRVVLLAMKRGHNVLGLDLDTAVRRELAENESFSFVRVDLRDYEATLEAIRGCDAILHLAAYPNPGDYEVTVHNSNVVISWNILRGAAELGIKRIAQASSVNVVTMVYSKHIHFEYFPIDENHPCLPDEPYGLSKVIMELQADAIVRRYPETRIASLRLHWSVPDRKLAYPSSFEGGRQNLWAYVQEDSAAEAFLLSVEDSARFGGHEAFFIVAPEVASDGDSNELRARGWPNVPIAVGKDVSGRKGFFDCSKAERLLGWVHTDKHGREASNACQ